MTSTVLKYTSLDTNEMRLGFIHIWGIATTSVNKVNLIYDGKEESLKFIPEPDKKILNIDLRVENVTLDKPIEINWS